MHLFWEPTYSSKKLLNFVAMQIQEEIGFDQLVELAKQLPLKQWTKLKKEVEKEKNIKNVPSDLETFLLHAPTFSKKQLDEIAKARKAISQWRIR